MSLFILDTDILALYRHGHPVVRTRVLAQDAKELAITVISVEETVSGWYRLLRRSQQPKQLARCYWELGDSVQFLGGWAILNYSESAIARYAQLSALKLGVRGMDLRIAAIALEHAGTIVTRNVRDFRRVPNLPVENWAV